MMKKQSIKGSISVFLVIIFTITYVFSGALVDGARIKLAGTMLETNLDNAAASALTYYDNLLFDLYGLFAEEEPDMAKVKDTMESYITKTFKLTGGDSDSAKLLTEIIFGDLPDGFDGYDFRIENLEVGSTLNLSQVEVTSSQIIEHMKYRAPLQMVSENMDGFLENLKELMSLTERFQAIKDKDSISKKYEGMDLFGDAQKLVDEIEGEFWGEVNKYLRDPINLMDTSEQRKDLWDYVEEYDEKILDIFIMIESDMEVSDDDEEGSAPSSDEVIQQALRQIDLETESLLSDLHTIIDNSQSLKEKAVDLKARIKTMNERYTVYISELESKKNEKSGSDEYKDIFESEIEMAKSSAGSVLRHYDKIMPVILHAEVSERRDKIYYVGSSVETIKQKIQDRTANRNDMRLKPYMNTNGELYFDEVNEKRSMLKEVYDKYKDDGEPTKKLKKSDIKTEEPTEPEEPETDERAKDITDDMLEGAVEDESVLTYGVTDVFKSMANPGEVSELMDRGMGFISALGSVIAENARDNLYINEYIMGNFQNYVHHYSLPKNKDSLNAPDKVTAKHLSEDPYKDYAFTVSEVEYIISGKKEAGGPSGSIVDVGAKIMVIRSILNTAAIFGDSSKGYQAAALASFAGPWAGVVRFLILIGWAVAESALDVYDIMQGEMVALYKKSGDWKISMENAFKQLLEKAGKALSTYLQDTTDKYLAAAENSVNKALYDAYNTISPEQMFGELEQELNKRMPEGLEDCNKEIMDTLKEPIVSYAEDKKEWVVSQVGDKFKSLKKEKNELISSKINSLSESIQKNVDELIPAGVEGDTSNLKFGYGDYLRVFLMFTPETTKVGRSQQIVQVNMRQKREGFRMDKAYVNIWADMEASIKYIFVTSAFMPESAKVDSSRHKIKVITNRTY